MDIKKYERLQKEGRLIFVVARDHERVMVGYVFVVLKQHPHYKTVTVAVDDMHFLCPHYRKGLNGKKMLQFAEAEAAKRGAKVFTMRCKADHDHGKIFESMGYELTDLVYVKDLTNAP